MSEKLDVVCGKREQVSEVRQEDPHVKLSKEDLRALSELKPLRSAGHIVLEWSLIMLAAILCRRHWSVAGYLVAVVFIGARQHALLILMHDGTHYRLFRNRAVNDWVTEVLLAWPHLVSMRSYRQNHLAHHNFVNTDQDPDWVRKKDNPEWHFPQSPLKLAGIFLRDLSGWGGVNLIRLASSLSAADRAPSKSYARARLGFYLAVVGLAVWMGWGKAILLFWVVPYFTWLIFIMRIRSIAEHFAIGGATDLYAQTRTTRIGPLARLFIAPKNVNYHLEHHLFPSVPFFRLPQLHALLMSKPEYASAAHITEAYGGVISECTSTRTVRPYLGTQIVGAMANE
ncbi:MAG TPA: fatty acid desaturase family protein [Candidatus Binataceae bacterium]|nr:fatty acid desaturase family protein [Candidatus Binataceae bacterium]